jgi:3-deoxy-D-manno-octulosonate 8-phosphate phosphatase (KDO 8-P phosphatase)
LSPSPAPELTDAQRAALASARLLALDVDGTLTDGSIVYSGEVEVVRFHVHDGQGLAWLRRAGVDVAWITGRGSRATRVRATECGVRALSTGVKDKRRALESVQAELGVSPEETVAMGDDLPDLALYRRARFLAAPADARPEVRAAADLVTRAGGGRGAVRELCEAILAARGLWDELLEAGGR